MAIDLKKFISSTCSNVSQSFYDLYVEANVRFRSRLGMKSVIIRRQLGNCCKWCANLAGIYDPSNAPDDIYRRHENCRCLVTYKSQYGYQDVWTKKERATQRQSRIDRLNEIANRMDREKFEKKLESLPEYFISRNTPESLKKMLEDKGFDVRPLGKGSLKGLLFENGGGYNIHYGGDGYFQYHPADGSHHDGPYYKISSGKKGTRRYNVDGSRKDAGRNTTLY